MEVRHLSQDTNSQAPLCPKCRQPITGNDRFCRHCGADLKGLMGARSAMKMAGAKRRIPRWPFVALGLAAGGVAAVIYGGHSKNVATTSALSPASAHQKSSSRSPAVPPSSTSPSPSPSSTSSSGPSSNSPSGSSPSSGPSAGSSPSSQGNPSHSGRYVSVSTSYQGSTLALTLPKPLDHLESSSSGAWQWGSQKGQVDMFVATHKPAAVSQILGPQTFGSPITRQGHFISQLIYIKWPGHGWVGSEIQVPRQHGNWLSTIAQSIQIS